MRESKSFSGTYLINCSIALNEILSIVEPQTHYFAHSMFKRESLTYVILLKKTKKFSIALYSDMYRHSKLGMMIETTTLYNCISLWMTLIFIQGYSCKMIKKKKKKKNFGVLFLANLSIDLDEFQYVATNCWFVDVHTKVFLFVCLLLLFIVVVVVVVVVACLFLHKLYSREITVLTSLYVIYINDSSEPI